MLTHWPLGQRGRLRAFEVSMALIANKSAEWRREADEEAALRAEARECFVCGKSFESSRENVIIGEVRKQRAAYHVTSKTNESACFNVLSSDKLAWRNIVIWLLYRVHLFWVFFNIYLRTEPGYVFLSAAVVNFLPDLCRMCNANTNDFSILFSLNLYS